MKKKFYLIVLCLFSHAFLAQQANHHFDDKPYIPGEFLVQTDNIRSIEDIVNSLPPQYEATVKQLVSKPLHTWLLTFNPLQISHEAFQHILYMQPGVKIADYNYKVELRSITPNDPQFSQQWHHVNTGQTGGTPDADIDSDLAWEITTGGYTTTYNDEIVVCIIESVNLTHVDLVQNRWINTNEIPGNGIDDDGNGYIDDYYGWNITTNNDNIGTGNHGTQCAGMAGAKGNNNLGVSGINWDVKLMSVAGSFNSQAEVIQAYTYPLEMRKLYDQTNGALGAFVVVTSASWGIDNANPNNYPLWCAMYDTLGNYGILNCGATTNNNANVDIVGDMPTACPSQYMIGVGRSNHNDAFAGGYGLTTIEFPAPGISVRTTQNTNSYGSPTGTSFACPLTAGVIALMYSIPCPYFMYVVKNNPQQAADMVLDALLKGVDKKPNMTNFFVTGGRLNARNALDSLMFETCGKCVPYTVSFALADASCDSVGNGSISLYVNGGEPPYTFTWSNGDSTSTISNLYPGTYTVVITDTSQCDTSFTFTINSLYNVGLSTNVNHVSCFGLNDGNAYGTAFGGVLPYNWQWQPYGGNNDTAFFLSAGTFYLTVTDSNGCPAYDTITIIQPPLDTVFFTHTTNLLQAVFTNYSSPGVYQWNFGDGNTSSVQHPVHTYAAQGTYWVCLELLTNCVDTSYCDSVTVISVDISEHNIQPLTAYFDASQQLLHINQNRLNYKQVQVFDATGRLLLQKQIHSLSQQIPIDSYAGGVYLYRLTGENRTPVHGKFCLE